MREIRSRIKFWRAKARRWRARRRGRLRRLRRTGGASAHDSRLARAFPVALVVAGFLVMAEGLTTMFWQEPLTALYASQRQSDLDQDLSTLEASADRARERAAVQQQELRTYVHTQAVKMAEKTQPGQPIGRIAIDKIGVNFVVVEATDEGSLQKGPGHYVETPLPGTGDWTVGIAGHRTTYAAPFRRIDELTPGDKVTVTMPYAKFTYAVEKTRIVDDEYKHAFRSTGHERLALTACHPLYSAAQRIIVYSRLKRIEPRGMASS